MLIQFFIILLVGAVGCMYLGIKYKKWLFPFFSTIMFMVLAFSAFRIEVVTGGVNLIFQEIVIVLLMWLATTVAAGLTLIGMINHLKESRDQKKNPIPKYGGL